MIDVTGPPVINKRQKSNVNGPYSRHILPWMLVAPGEEYKGRTLGKKEQKQCAALVREPRRACPAAWETFAVPDAVHKWRSSTLLHTSRAREDDHQDSVPVVREPPLGG